MTLTYTAKLDLKIQSTKLKDQKIDGSIFKIFDIIFTSFQVKNKLSWPRFFYKPCLIANIAVAVILGMLFLTLSKTNILFAEKKFT